MNKRIKEAAAAFAHDTGALKGLPMFKQTRLYEAFLAGAAFMNEECAKACADYDTSLWGAALC